MPELLSVRNLRTQFFTDRIVTAVDDVSFDVRRGETLGIVGESGSGKTVTALSIMRVVPPPGRVVGGQIMLEGVGDLLSLPEDEMTLVRGRRVAITLQDPMTSLNPVMKVGDQIVEGIRHRGANKRDALKQAQGLMELVGIPSPAARMNDYPHQLSGGMRQRILIAMALSCEPELLIADEPTSALDVIIQDEILDLMKQLKARLKTSLVIITHDLGIVAELADRVLIMYAGRVLEISDVKTVFSRPRHPYTEALLRAIPRLDVPMDRLDTIEGSIPNMASPPSGCRFHPRCPYVKDICRSDVPKLQQVRDGHLSACIRHSDIWKD